VHSSFVTRFCACLLAALFVVSGSAQTPAASPVDALKDAQQLFRRADFRGSAAAFRRLTEAPPKAEAYFGLVESLLKLDDVKAAEDSSQKALAALPESAAIHAARGDVHFRRGLIAEAQDEYKTALKLDEKCARAWLGQGKVDAVFVRRDQAKTAIAKAHDLDPEDGDALYEWAVRQPYPGNVAALEKHLAEFHNDEETERHEREYKELLKALAGRPVWIEAHKAERAEIKLELLTDIDLVTRGYGLRVRLNDRATVTLLLDTGSSGVTITRKLAEKVGAKKLSDQALEGVGSTGASLGYKAWVDKIAIGELEFRDCFVQTTPNEIAGVDGTIGTNIFANYLVTLDFPGRKLRLEPLPQAADDASHSRPGFSQAFTFGHILLVPTDVGKKASGLFVVDSGANVNTISPDLARSVPDMRSFNLPVSGASGRINSAWIADNATLHFATVRKTGEHITSVDLHSISKDLGVEVSGQIGYSTMQGMKVSINYRDGTVGFVEK